MTESVDRPRRQQAFYEYKKMLAAAERAERRRLGKATLGDLLEESAERYMNDLAARWTRRILTGKTS
jgi:hypothetical protein